MPLFLAVVVVPHGDLVYQIKLVAAKYFSSAWDSKEWTCKRSLCPRSNGLAV